MKLASQSNALLFPPASADAFSAAPLLSFLEISELSQDAVCYWQLSEPLNLSLPAEEQVNLIYEHASLQYCNVRAVELVGAADRAAMVAMGNADLVALTGTTATIAGFIEKGFAEQQFWFEFTDLLGHKRRATGVQKGTIDEGVLTGFWCVIQDLSDRDEREQRLRIGQQLLEDTEALAGLGSWCRDFVVGDMTLSANLPKLFGLPPQDRMYSIDDFFRRVHPADRDHFITVRDFVLSSSGEQVSDYRVIRDDGSIRHMHAVAFMEVDDRGEPVRMVGTVQDVTQERLAQERRQAHFDNHPDPMFLLDLQMSMPVSLPVAQQTQFLAEHSRIADCNQAMATLLGRSRAEVLDAPVEFIEQLWDLNAQAFCEQGFSLKNRVVKLRRPAAQESDAWIQFDASGTVEGTALTRIWGCLRDVTELAQARNQLQLTVNERTRELYAEIERRKRDERLLKQQAVIWSQMSEGVIIWSLEGRIQDWNRAAEKTFGFSREDVMGSTAGLLHASTADNLRPDDFVAWFSEHDTWSGELVFKHSGGQVVVCETSLTALRDDENQIISVLEVNRDVSERKAYDVKLARAKKQAEDANQAKSQFLWSMSHELRTPLNAILGFSQLLERHGEPDLSDQQHAYIEHIRSGGEHLLRLVNDVLDLARIEAGAFDFKLEPLEPAEVCRDSLELIRPQAAGRELKVFLDLAPTERILADYTRLKQILVNLLSNAVKYNSPGGELRLVLRQNVGRVRIEITDTGCGIAHDQRAQLFEPFNRLGVTADVAVGSGLGLPITASLVNAMDAHLGVDSVPGQGSTFWLEFINLGAEFQMALDW